MSTRHLILGTAGHIDHGKSALVQALTGIDPDRLKEEKSRGITIELGFADLDLGEGRVLSFVDVPGHERFVRHMVAGAAGIDAVLLVIAADDGVCPQSREHLDICKLLGVRHGLVALSKADLADEELLEVLKLEVREFVEGSFLENAPIVPVSARAGTGLDDLRGALEGLFDEVPARPPSGIARLPVDRSFVLRGFGTVVTGTLASGSLREGEEVAIMPGERRARIRGLQVHHRRVEEARSGQRTAVNLQGLDRDEVPRGSTVCRPGSLQTTTRIWASIRLLPSAPRALQQGGRARFHQGTCERSARFRVLGTEETGDLTAEIRLGEEAVLLPGDRFILRRPAPVDTVGGGVVLDVRPPRAKASAVREFQRATADGGEALVLRLTRAGVAGRSPSDLAAELGIATKDLDDEIGRLRSEGRVFVGAGLLFDADVWERLIDDVGETLGRFHRENPLREGMSREELRARLCREMPQEAWRAWLATAESEGQIRLEGDRVALAGHRVVMSNRDRSLAERIRSRFLTAGLDPPELAEVIGEEAGERADRIVELLVRGGDLVRLADGRYFSGEALEDLRSKLREYARTSRKIDVGAFKQLAGVTRKNAIPLLEHLDAERVTRRIGNAREILDVPE
jgi:selenocysteine-specific elongation factor